MSDSINRQLAIDSIMAAGKIGKLSCCDILRKMPSAQPERKKGKWIVTTKHHKDDQQEFYYYETRCSECSAKRRIGWCYAKYCPNCGSEMEEGDQP